MKKLVWGVLSTARIGLEKVIPALQGSALGEVRAIASRSLQRSQDAAARLGIAKAYGRYEDLLADPEIEAVYNPLPNDQHVSWTLAAARAGKHVLCEKPMALNAQELSQLREVAQQVHIMEAFMVRFHPQWERVRALVRSGEIGEVLSIQAFFSYTNTDPANIRNIPAHGGGALYDIGCYPITIGRFLYEAEPVRVMALIDRDPQFGTDRHTSALLDFGQGRRLDFTVSTQCTPYQRVQVLGSKQRIEVQIPFNAPLGGPTRFFIDDGQHKDDSARQTQTTEACDMYGLQGDAFARAVRGQAPLAYGLDDALAQMRVIDALFRSESSGHWERPAAA